MTMESPENDQINHNKNHQPSLTTDVDLSSYVTFSLRMPQDLSLDPEDLEDVVMDLTELLALPQDALEGAMGDIPCIYGIHV